MIINSDNIAVTLGDHSNQNTPLTIKHAGTQCRELTNNFWRWLDLEKTPAIALLPVGIVRMPASDCPPVCIACKNMGRVKSTDKTVVVELLDENKNSSKSHHLMEFETRGEAQAFAKRVRRGKHQTLLVGERCKRVITIGSRPDTNLNTVSLLGQALRHREVSIYESLPTESFDELVKELARINKTGNAEIQIGIDESVRT